MIDESPGRDSGLLLRPVHGGNAFEETVQRLLQTVRLGLIAPGERLPAERELAAMLAVSRDTLRDALKSLAEAGYLVARRGRYGGTFVTEVLPGTGEATDGTRTRHTQPNTGGSEVTDGADGTDRGASGSGVPAPAHPLARRVPPAREIDDALTLREILEVGAARHAAARTLGQAAREQLWASLAESRAATGADYRRLDSRLHLMIGELAGSPSLVPLLAEVRMRVNELLDAIPLLGPNIVHSDRQHEEIVAAILAGRPDAAAQAMAEHLAGTALLLRGFLE
ncbi:MULTISPECIES: FadR/GntR family transcriptional regulator [unclassified Cryobacterium]|uniref:FadR/GntR family transcriptional regulator n=1 Tax=unclassified Cryobacterium TaxID=2649013 RepID=UPI002AB4467F|nr:MULTISPECIES: FCD domain-containing protein [unclassified Cryobacterium]MDY7543208.1 GntR family transcriptional regulator [Cryobacterium sp. 5B3]MEA9998392.1 GntR family transcriptional regulator [Cryobacterium sp. RTS3]MEB0265286.1 GntR family transcriptional regulator [Cryobacterium sp. 10I5]MEB0274316.1 GntR family transcriptional regulator [Cryobacterium sp. 5B3]